MYVVRQAGNRHIDGGLAMTPSLAAQVITRCWWGRHDVADRKDGK